VCRDYAHLAISFCRCLNIPARYCSGYLGDIGMPPPYGPMDFASWFEAYLGGRWYIFDARNNIPRIGRVLIARPGRSRRADHSHVRPEHAGQFQGLDRRGNVDPSLSAAPRRDGADIGSDCEHDNALLRGRHLIGRARDMVVG
jgi:transglutaminase-like putative cysteine protease